MSKALWAAHGLLDRVRTEPVAPSTNAGTVDRLRVLSPAVRASEAHLAREAASEGMRTHR